MQTALYYDLHLSSLYRERQTTFRADLKALGNGILDIPQCFFLSVALADAARNRRALHDPYALFISINGYIEYHAQCSWGQLSG
jgi:hypothetical protein